jgi:preprotein translocase SecE subunit
LATTITMNNFINYLKDTAAELKHVSWPTHAQTVVYTVLVVVLSVVVALYTGLFDYVFSKALNWFIG